MHLNLQKDFLFLAYGYFLGAITSLSDLSEIHLFGVVFLLGGMLGASGKFIRAKDDEFLLPAIFVGMTMALIGVLFGSMWEERVGRNAVVGGSLVLAMMGSNGAKLIVELLTTKLMSLFKKGDAKE